MTKRELLNQRVILQLNIIDHPQLPPITAEQVAMFVAAMEITHNSQCSRRIHLSILEETSYAESKI